MAKGRKTGGCRPGTRNKITTALKDVILGAPSDAGGQAWLVEQAGKNHGKPYEIVEPAGEQRIIIQWGERRPGKTVDTSAPN